MFFTKKKQKLLILSGMFLLFCSCLPRYAIDFKTVDFTKIGVDRTDFDAKIWVYYKWIAPLTLSDVKYSLFINDNLIGEGKYPEDISLGKYADTLLVFPCTVKFSNIVGPLLDILLRGKFDYEVRIDYTVQIKDWIRKYKTSYKGRRKL